MTRCICASKFACSLVCVYVYVYVYVYVCVCVCVCVCVSSELRIWHEVVARRLTTRGGGGELFIKHSHSLLTQGLMYKGGNQISWLRGSRQSCVHTLSLSLALSASVTHGKAVLEKVCVHVHACMRACVRACVRACGEKVCVHVCVCVCVACAVVGAAAIDVSRALPFSN